MTAEEGLELPADPITIEAAPRADASPNGAGSSERAPKKRMLIIVLHFSHTA